MLALAASHVPMRPRTVDPTSGASTAAVTKYAITCASWRTKPCFQVRNSVTAASASAVGFLSRHPATATARIAAATINATPTCAYGPVIDIASEYPVSTSPAVRR